MKGKELYIVRHGETEYNRLGIVQGSGIDSQINAEGRRQSLKLFQHLKNTDIEVIYSSHLIRAVQTIAPFSALNIPIYTDDRLREINWGVHEGKKYSEITTRHYSRVIQAWYDGDIDARLDQAESARELMQRLESFVEYMSSIEEKKVLICSHGRTIRALLTILTHSPSSAMQDFHHSNGGIYVLSCNGVEIEILERNLTRYLE